jgi:hypothetical protein
MWDCSAAENNSGLKRFPELENFALPQTYGYPSTGGSRFFYNLSFKREPTMFGRILCGGAAILACASIVCADDKADIQAATQKLADASSYSYTTTTEVPNGGFGAGTNQGKIDKAGATWLSIQGFQGNTTEVLIKGDKTAVKPSDGGWQTMQEFTAAGDNGGGFNPAQFLAMQVDTAKDPVARALEMFGAWQ